MRRIVTCAAAFWLLLHGAAFAQQRPPSGVLGIHFDRKPKAPGLPLTHVLAGGPAWVAGLRPGDIVVLMDGLPATPDSISALPQREPGHRVSVVYLRNGKRFSVTLVREESRTAYERAAGLNDATAQMLLADLAFDAQDRAEGCRWARRAADTNLAHAQARLGWCYTQGVAPLPKDPAQAAYWLRRGAEQKSPGAQYLLGIAYLNGAGVPQDDAEGVRLLRASADQGHAGGLALLGDVHRDGRGVTKDVREAARYYARALHASPWPELREYIDKAVATLTSAGQLTTADVDSLKREEGERKRAADEAAKLRVSSLHLAAQPRKAQVYVDGTLRGTTSEADGELLIEGLAPGQHAIRISADGYKDWQSSISIAAGIVSLLDVPLERAGPKPLGVAEVEDALRNGISSTRVAEMVRQYGVDFALSDDIERRLRAAGADDSLLLAIAKARRS